MNINFLTVKLMYLIDMFFVIVYINYNEIYNIFCENCYNKGALPESRNYLTRDYTTVFVII